MYSIKVRLHSIRRSQIYLRINSTEGLKWTCCSTSLAAMFLFHFDQVSKVTNSFNFTVCLMFVVFSCGRKGSYVDVTSDTKIDMDFGAFSDHAATFTKCQSVNKHFASMPGNPFK